MHVPKVSIIVPVYKVEKYLSRCIDSILSQTYTDFELLLVDDGSPDRSGAICDEYAKIDSRIRVFHKENGGVSSARNLGIDKAKGLWTSFIDSDDYWCSEKFLSMFDKVGDNIDIVHFGYTLETKSKKLIRTSEFNCEQYVDTVAFFQRGIFSSSSWAYFFSTDHLHKFKIRFNESVKYSEDREFIIKSILLSGKQILLLRNCDYIYTYNINAATKTKRSFKYCLDDLTVLRNIFALKEQHNIKFDPNVNSFISFLMLDSFILTISRTYSLFDIKKILQSRRKLKDISEEYPNIDNKFPRYKYFLMFPVLTTLYYKIRQKVKNIVQIVTS